jgi:hypothetical protein
VVGLALAAATSQAVLFATGVGKLALVDQWERTALAFGQDVDDARYAGFHALSQHGPLYGAATAILTGPVLTVALAALVFAVFRGKGDRTVSYSQVLSVMAHASVIPAIRQILGAPISYARETTSSATSLGVWLPTLDQASPVARFMSALDFFVLWWVVLVAVGVSVLYGRRARPLAAAFVGVYAGLALLLAATMTALGGTS